MKNLVEISDPTFLSRFYKTPEQLQDNKRYLVNTMRTSIFENIIVKYLFKYQTDQFSLSNLIEELSQNHVKYTKLLKELEYYVNTFNSETHPLYIYSQIAKEIQEVLKENIKKMKYDKFILKLEYLLSIHFENNFSEHQINNQISSGFFDKMYLQHKKTNFNYSLNALNTIMKFLQVFEKQNIGTRTANDYLNFKEYFISEKVYYFYCEKTEKEKVTSGNFVNYLITNLITKLDACSNDKVNNIQLENYSMINMYFIKKVIQNYSFYFHKRPELEQFFFCIQQLKTWPLPVGTFCSDLSETIINECAFQGITILNRLRELYFLDIIDHNITEIQTQYFNSPCFVYSNAWEKDNKNIINTEIMTVFNLAKFLKFMVTKDRKERYNVLNMNEFLIKVFITFVYNSKQTFTDESFDKIYQKFYSSQVNNSSKSNLDIILKIIDVGFDKGIEDFDKEINIIANKLLNLDNLPIIEENENEEIGHNRCFSQNKYPITDMRNYLKPRYAELKKLNVDEGDLDGLDLYELYNTNFQLIVNNYFSHLLVDSEDPHQQKYIQALRNNLYINFKVDVILIEQKNMIEGLINHIRDCYNNISTKMTDEDFESFWHFFIPDKNALEIKYIVRLVPHYEMHTNHPFKLFNEEGNNDTDGYLSEFIASNDNIYKNIVYLPWLCKCDHVFSPYIQNCQNVIDNILEFPNLNVIYSFLKNSLNYYITDANGLFNLNLYRLDINALDYDVIFWKGLTISCVDPRATTKLM